MAVTEPLWPVVKDPASSVNVAVLDPEPTTTEDGAVSRLFVVDKATVAPPAGAFAVSVTVHVVETVGLSVAVVQVSEETSADTARLTVAVAEVLL